jgi:hypothetical protein
LVRLLLPDHPIGADAGDEADAMKEEMEENRCPNDPAKDVGQAGRTTRATETEGTEVEEEQEQEGTRVGATTSGGTCMAVEGRMDRRWSCSRKGGI